MGAEVGDQLVLMDIDAGRFYGLDAIAAIIWRRIQYPVTVADVIKACIADYDGSPDQIEADILRLLQGLAEHRLILVS